MLTYKIDILSLKFKDEKLRNTIKTNILNGLIFIKKFLESSPGIISPSKVCEKINQIKEYLGVWVKNKDLIDSTNDIFKEIIDKYINLVDEEDTEKPKEQSIEINKLSEKPVKDYVPWYTKKLFNGIEVKRQDVAYLPIGPCHHYCIVYKVLGDKTYIIPITTNIDAFDGYVIEKSRFFKGKAIFSIYQYPTSVVKDKLVLPYDHKSEVNNIFKALEEFMTSILPKKRLKIRSKTSKPYK